MHGQEMHMDSVVCDCGVAVLMWVNVWYSVYVYGGHALFGVCLR